MNPFHYNYYPNGQMPTNDPNRPSDQDSYRSGSSPGRKRTVYWEPYAVSSSRETVMAEEMNPQQNKGMADKGW